MWSVLVTAPPLLQAIDEFRPLFEQRDVQLLVASVEQQLSEAELIDLVGSVDGVIAGDDPFTDRVFAAAPRLRVLAKWGVGLDAVDVGAAERRGIRVFNVPGQLGSEVADVVMGYVVMLLRRLHDVDRSVREGRWEKPRGRSLAGKTIGIVGLGSIGRAVARRAHAAEMKVIAHDVAQRSGDDTDGFVELVELDELIRGSDIISLNCNLTEANRHLLNEARFGMMRRGVFVINTARGALIDEDALVEAFREGKVRGAALDVFESEPLPPDSPLRDLPGCILGSHNSSNTDEAVRRVTLATIDNLLSGLEGPTG